MLQQAPTIGVDVGVTVSLLGITACTHINMNTLFTLFTFQNCWCATCTHRSTVISSLATKVEHIIALSKNHPPPSKTAMKNFPLERSEADHFRTWTCGCLFDLLATDTIP